jgi:thiamine-monophosphate kinase
MTGTPIDPEKSGSRVENETDLIATYLAPLAEGMPGAFRLTDDAAVISPAPGTDLVFSSDPIIAGVHFFSDDRPGDIAWKALACNVSDMAAKGAQPIAYLLTLALPAAPGRTWIADFAEALQTAQEKFGCKLIGGDTDRTPGPLTIGITIIGSVPSGTFVPRHGSHPGDRVFVTGTIGDAALGLALRRDPTAFKGHLSDTDREFLRDRYLRPKPRSALADVVRTHARAALDVSDGLLKDLSRLAGPLGIAVDFDAIPLSPPARAALAADPKVRDAVLAGGDDYELLVAVPPEKAGTFAESAKNIGIDVCDIGAFEAGTRVLVRDTAGQPIEPHRLGYDHFSR